VNLFGHSPSRRRILRILGTTMVAAPLAKLGHALAVHERRRHPKDLPPIPWIGHC
jgi:hypothetical protein